MAVRVVIRPAAESDLDSIYEFVAQDSPSNAIEFTRRIREFCMKLAHFPERGTRRDDLRPGIRVIGFERRVGIAFEVVGDRVEVARILYGGRDLKNALREESS